MFTFRTITHTFRRMEELEIRQLRVGDRITICVNWNPPEEAEFVDATVIRPLFWNSDADEPDWEIETTNGFVDLYSVYEVIKI